MSDAHRSPGKPNVTKAHVLDAFMPCSGDSGMVVHHDPMSPLLKHLANHPGADDPHPLKTHPGLFPTANAAAKPHPMAEHPSKKHILPGVPAPAKEALKKHACHLEGKHTVPKTHEKPEHEVADAIKKVHDAADKVKDEHMKKTVKHDAKELKDEHDKLIAAKKEHAKNDDKHKELSEDLQKAHAELKALEAKTQALLSAKEAYCGEEKKKAAVKEVAAKKEEVKHKAIAVAHAEKDKKKSEVKVAAANHNIAHAAEAVRKIAHVAEKTAKTAHEHEHAKKAKEEVHKATVPLKHDVKVKMECDFVNYDLIGKLAPLPHVDEKYPCMGFARGDDGKMAAIKCEMAGDVCPLAFDKDKCFVMKLDHFTEGLHH